MIAGIIMPLREERLGGKNYLVRKHRAPGIKGLQPPPSWQLFFKTGATMIAVGCSCFHFAGLVFFSGWKAIILTSRGIIILLF